MSIVIQKQIISNVCDLIVDLQEKEAQLDVPDAKLKGDENAEKVAEYNKLLNSVQLSWSEFVEKTIGDDDNMGTYAKLITATEAMDKPLELAIQFNTIRGQFVSSEDKFINLLIEAGFEEGEDYQKITVENEKIEEELLFFSYRCLKTFVLDKDEKNMLRALLIGEEIYRMYKIYSESFAKKASPKTHWMVVEQTGGFDGAIGSARETLHDPETVLKIVTGSKKSIKKHMQEMKKNPDNWGKVIIPMTEAIYASALDDVKRMVDTLKQNVFDAYKKSVKAAIKKSKPDDKKALTGIVWMFKTLSTGIAIDPTCKDLDYDDIIVKVKEFWLNTLSQTYTPLKKRSHKEYLECISELEKSRSERYGYFSAIKNNAIHCAKMIEKAKKLGKERKSATKGKKKDPKTTYAATKHGYATGGSDAEEENPKKNKKDESDVEEENPKKSESKAKKNAKKADSDEEKPKKAKKKADSDEEEKPKVKKSAKKVVIAEKEPKDDSDSEEDEPKAKPVKKNKRPVVIEKDDSESSDDEEDEEDEEDYGSE